VTPLALYRGRIEHARLRPLRHAFGYRVGFIAVDLAELAACDRDVWYFGYNRRRPLAIRDRDYFEPDDRPIADKLRSRFPDLATGRTVLVTTPSGIAGSFNPLSMYLCHDGDGRLSDAVAEVANTFGERIAYRLALTSDGRGGFHATTDKQLFVSPFHGVQGEYRFHLTDPGERFALTLRLIVAGEAVIHASWSGRRVREGLLAAGFASTAGLLAPLRIAHQGLMLRIRGLRPVMKPRPPASTHRSTARRWPEGASGGAGRGAASQGPDA
jgi:DUF1365 family protein